MLLMFIVGIFTSHASNKYLDYAFDYNNDYTNRFAYDLFGDFDDMADEGADNIADGLKRGDFDGVDGGVKSGKYTITESLRKHIENIDFSVPRKRGIGGAHNKNIFLQNDIKIVSCTSHPNINGVEIIEYQMPKLDKTGTPILGEYQNCIPKVKTVYDPNVISTDEYLQRGIEAANNASKKYPDGKLPREWIGIDNQGITWRGYCDNGEITSMYPD